MKKTFVIILTLLFLAPLGEAKLADLAGKWYASDPVRLRSELEGYLYKAGKVDLRGRLIGAIVPHAGFRFSGEIAAYVYKAIMQDPPDTIVLIGFTHRKYYPQKIAVFGDTRFSTPLGGVKIDTQLTRKFIEYDDIVFEALPKAFDNENSVEMQIPFIQVASPDSELVIMAVADQRLDNIKVLAKALEEILKNEKSYVIIASTDMSHYLKYEEATQKDCATIETIKKMDPMALYVKNIRNNNELMCGGGAVYSVMAASKALGANEVEILKYANSGDTSGDKSKVVGYLSAAFIEAPGKGRAVSSEKEGAMFTNQQKKELLKLARNTIDHYLKTGKKLPVEIDDKVLNQDMGAFVTLHKGGRLRGCIGNMRATAPLCMSVRDMAISASTRDPRFPPVKASEMKDIDIEISALSPMEKIEDPSIIEMGKHGVMVRRAWQSGVYLPQVALETGWTKDEFMDSLCASKAGIPADSWRTGDCDIYVFTAEVFGDKEFE